MITGTEAVLVLVAVNKGTYTEHKYNTTEREFKPSYDKDQVGFCHEELFNKVLATYVSHEWINE